MPVSVQGLNHFTIRCAASELPALHDFYIGVLGLEKGRRPDIPAPGTWLYAGGVAIVHLYAYLDRPEDASDPVTGPLDHISFKGRGLEATKAQLRAMGVPFTQAPVPGWNIEQLFLRDPKGLKIELTFFLDEEGGRA